MKTARKEAGWPFYRAVFSGVLNIAAAASEPVAISP
jgi:hypothetical protein